MKLLLFIALLIITLTLTTKPSTYLVFVLEVTTYQGIIAIDSVSLAFAFAVPLPFGQKRQERKVPSR